MWASQRRRLVLVALVVVALVVLVLVATDSAAHHRACGGDLPPCSVMECESGGNLTARNASGAAGKWQIMPGTWAGYGGYPSADQAPEDVQDARAAELWAGGAGAWHWTACLPGVELAPTATPSPGDGLSLTG